MVVRGGSGEEFTVDFGFVKFDLPSGTERYATYTGLSCPHGVGREEDADLNSVNGQTSKMKSASLFRKIPSDVVIRLYSFVIFAEIKCLYIIFFLFSILSVSPTFVSGGIGSDTAGILENRLCRS